MKSGAFLLRRHAVYPSPSGASHALPYFIHSLVLHHTMHPIQLVWSASFIHKCSTQDLQKWDHPFWFWQEVSCWVRDTFSRLIVCKCIDVVRNKKAPSWARTCVEERTIILTSWLCVTFVTTNGVNSCLRQWQLSFLVSLFLNLFQFLIARDVYHLSLPVLRSVLSCLYVRQPTFP